MDELLSEFLTECCEGMATLDAELVSLERNPEDRVRIASIFRIVHTIKGTCGFLALTRLERVAHAAENVLGRLREGTLDPTPEALGAIFAAIDRVRSILDHLAAHQSEPQGDDDELVARLERAACGTAPAATGAPPPAAADTRPELTSAAEQGSDAEGKAETVSAQALRVRLDLLEQLMNLVGELVLTRNQLLQAVRHETGTTLQAPLQRLDQITAELQDNVMRTRMQPIGSAWSKLPRLARDLGLELGKHIDLRLEGGDTELDRQILDLIKDPLTHMVRNSADHGLEGPAERRARGKPERGTIRLEAFQEGGHIIVRVADDGRGLDVERIKAKALAQRLATEAEAAGMSEEQVRRFIFRAGFSTAEQVSSVSGRGVGMDVVRTNIERIGGSIELTSEVGCGTTFTIKIPLTLAIVSVLIVGVGGQRFGVPQLGVVELVRAARATDHRIEVVDGAPILRLRSEVLPLVSLGGALGLACDPPSADRPAHVVVVRAGSRCAGLLVDRVFDTEEIVVKPLAPILRPIRVLSGNAILGDGGIITILDLNALLGGVEGAHGRTAEAPDEAARPEENTALLLFRAGSPAPKAVPLGLVTRLEEVAAESVEWAGERTVVQYRGQLMPIVDIDGVPARLDGGRRPVLVFTDGGRHMGLVVEEIIDIVEADVALELKSDRASCLGSAVIGGRSTELLDVAHFVNRVFGGWFAEEVRQAFAAGTETPVRRLLLVDDSAFFRNLLRPILEADGYEVTLAPSPDHALRLRDRGERFDVIVSDIEMPGMNGFEFAAACRADGTWRSTPMVALTSHTTPTDLARGRQAGFLDYVGKLDRGALLAALSQAQDLQRKAA